MEYRESIAATVELSLETEKRGIEAFEMYVYRRILKISWPQKITDLKFLIAMPKQKELLITWLKDRSRWDILGDRLQNSNSHLIGGRILGRRIFTDIVDEINNNAQLIILSK